MAPCCVSSCSNRGELRCKKNSGISYHLFPRDMVKRKRWVESIARRNWQPSNSTVVCSDHFESSCFYLTQYGLKRLVDDAVPTINLNEKKPTSSDDLLSRLETILQTKPTEDALTEIIAKSLIPEMPEITPEDTQKTKDLAAQFMRLTVIYEKQKKKIRNLRQKLKRLGYKLDGLGNSDVVLDKVKREKKKKDKKREKAPRLKSKSNVYLESIINMDKNYKETDPLN